MTSERIVPLSEYHRLPQAALSADFYKRQLEVVCNNATLALFIMDDCQRCVYMNPAAETLTGYSLTETQGRALHDVIHHTRPDGRPYPLCECPIDQVFPQNNREQGEEVFVHKDGHFYPVAYTASPIREGETTIGTIIEVRDITQEKLDQQARQDASIALASINDGFYTLDLNWCFTYVNDRYCQMVAMPPSELLGQNIWELFPAAVDTEAYVQFHQAMADQAPRQFNYLYTPWNCWHDHRIYPSPTGLTVLIADITDRKQAEERARKTAEIDAFRVAFTDALRPLADFAAIQATASRMLGEYLSANRVAYFEVRGADYVVERDYVNGAEPLAGCYPVESFGEKLLNAYRAGHPTCAADVTTDSNLSPEQRSAYAAIQIAAYIGIPLVIADQFVAGLGVHAVNPRVWTAEEIDLTREVAERTWVAIERVRAEVALRESEARYRTLFESMDDGFCRVELLYDEHGQPVDQQILDANSAFERHTGLTQPQGKLISELMPGLEQSWNELYGQVVATGKPKRLEEYSPAYDRWFNVQVSLIGEQALHQLAVIFRDITDRKQAEAVLRESEQRFRRLVESSIFGVAFGDFAGGIHYANDYFLNLVGYSREEIETGQLQWTEITPDKFLPLDQAAMLELRSQGVAKPFEKEFIRKDGSRVPILIGSALLQDPYDQQQEIVAFFLDLTERKQAEAALAYNEARLRGFVEANVVGMLYGDIYGNINVANDEFLRIVGYPREDLQSGSLRWDHITPSEFLPLDEQRIAEARDRGACTPYEKEYIRKDGSRVPVLIGYSLVGEAREESVAFILDLTDRKQAEQERERLLQQEQILRQQAESAERRLYELLESIREDFVLYDRDWRVVYLNSQATLSMQKSRDEILGKCFWDLFPDLVGTEFYDRLHQAMHEQTSLQFEYHYEIWDTWFENRVYPTDEGIIVLSSNISDRVQFERDRERILQQEQAAREAAENANRIKDEFLAVLSHELRSPLNPILGWSKLLQKGDLNPAKTKTALATIDRNAQLQVQLIDDLLDISRILRGKLSLNVLPIDLSAVISAALETVHLAAEAKAIRIQTVISPDVGAVMGDAGRLQQVVWNLLSNAVKFTPPSGQVTVALAQAGIHAQIQVIDTGKGIKSDFLPYVFEHFRQEDGATTRKFGGLGLGLAIARQIVEMHGGQIWVDSPGEGQGATFTVLLPLAPHLSELPSSEESSPATSDLNGIHILVVDDEADSREIVAFVLEQARAVVTHVSSGIEALQVIEQSAPDVIVSDIGMPEMDGYMLLQQIRSLDSHSDSIEQGKRIPAIALTAYAGEYDRQQAISAGF